MREESEEASEKLGSLLDGYCSVPSSGEWSAGGAKVEATADCVVRSVVTGHHGSSE